MVRRIDRRAAERAVMAELADLQDPEIPVLTLTDLGLIRWVRVDRGDVTVGVAPTYTGCPATEVIQESIRARLRDRGYPHVSVESVLSPPWTTDWITADGRRKLEAYGIAPPQKANASKRSLLGRVEVPCPRCQSTETSRVSEFGSTPCKASYKCDACLEPFEYFKCI